MSNPFDPMHDTSDPLPSVDEPRREVSPLLLGCGLLLMVTIAACLLGGMILAGVWFAARTPNRPATITRNPPVAEQLLNDRSLLVVEQVTAGRRHYFDFSFDKPPQSRLSIPTPHDRTGDTVSTDRDALVVWLTQWDGPGGNAKDMDWVSRCVVVDKYEQEIACLTKGRNAHGKNSNSNETTGSDGPFSPLTSGPYQMIVTHYSFPPFRHDGQTFKLRLYDLKNQKVAEIAVPNPIPSAGQFPIWKPEPLPITQTDGDLAFTLVSLTAKTSEQNRSHNGFQWKEKRTQLIPQFLAEQNGNPSTIWGHREIQVFDALGNENAAWNCKLSPRETAWNLQVKAWKNHDAKFDEDQIWTLSQLPMPKDSQIQLVNKSHSWDDVSIEILSLVGPGKVAYPDLGTGSQGTRSSSGNLTFGKGNAQRRIPYEIRSEEKTGTIDCAAPYLLLAIQGLTRDRRLILRASDKEGNQITLNGPRGTGAMQQIWFIDPSVETDSLNLELIVHRCRTFDFNVAPPKTMPVAPNQVKKSPRSIEQRLSAARETIQTGESQLTPGKRNANTLNNLAWAYATAPEPVRDSKKAVAMAEEAVALAPENRNNVNTLGMAYYHDGQYERARETLEKNATGQTEAMLPYDLYPLCMAYFQLDDKDKARETYQRAWSYRAGSGEELPPNQQQELIELRDEAATLLLGESPKTLFDKAEKLARQGQWEQAADEFARTLDVYPDQHWRNYQSGTLHAYLDRVDEYRLHCERMLELFQETSNPYIAERIGKLCLLLPDLVEHQKRAAHLCDKAVAMDPNPCWFQLAAGIARYRADQFDQSLAYIESAQTSVGNQTYCEILIAQFRAMNEYQLGEKETARQSIEVAAEKLQDTVPEASEDGTIDFGTAWHDRLICQIIQREAERLIQPATIEVPPAEL